MDKVYRVANLTLIFNISGNNANTGIKECRIGTCNLWFLKATLGGAEVIAQPLTVQLAKSKRTGRVWTF